MYMYTVHVVCLSQEVKIIYCANTARLCRVSPKLTNSYSHFSKKLWTMADTKSSLYNGQGLVAIVKDIVANGWCG